MEHASGVLEAQSLKGDYLWTIKGFSLLDSSVGREVDSEVFDLVGSRWQLSIFPGGFDEKHKGYVAAFVCHLGNAKIRARWKMDIVDTNGDTLKGYLPEADDFDGKYKCWGHYQLISRDVLLDYEKGYLADEDTLRIKCTLQTTVHKTALARKADFRVGVSSSMGALLETGKLRSDRV